MELGSCRIIVYFEDPFWVGLYERSSEDGYEVCKITFGAEPKDYEVHAALLEHWRELTFSPALPAERAEVRRQSAKRVRREVKRQLSGPPVGTKAQQALKLQREEGKEARKAMGREAKETEERRKFELRQEKKKEKHRGH